MIYRFFAWYRSMPLLRRRFLVFMLVPVQEYIFFGPSRRALNFIAKSSPNLAIASLPAILVMGVMTAAIVCIFAYEFLGIGKDIKNRFIRLFVFSCVLGCILTWVIFPLHVIKMIGDK